MGEHALGNDRTTISSSAWLREHLFDVTVVLLGTVLTLRFWYILFGVEDARVIAILAAAALCEACRSVIAARRSQVRPALVSSDRRSDLLAAIALATAPW